MSLSNNEQNVTPTPETEETSVPQVTDDVENIEVIDESDVTAPSKKKPARERKAKTAKKKFNSRRLRFGSTSTALTIVVIVAVILLNVIVGIVADKFPLALDLSTNKMYTLSEQSVDIAKKITGDMKVVVFSEESEFRNPSIGSQNGIPELDTTIKEFYNALQQYKNYSGGKFQFEFIDSDQEPAKFSEYEKKYEAQLGSVLFLYGDRYKMRTLDDLYYLDASNYQTTGSYNFSSTVEKTMASTVHSLVAGNDKVVQVLTGHSEDSNAIAGLKSIYELNGYTFEELSITGSAPFNEKAEIMLIAAPQADYSAAEIKRVRDWVYNNGNYGHHLMVFVHPTADCPNLYEYLDVEYKVQVTKEIIYETDLNRMDSYNGLYALGDVPSSELLSSSVSTAKLYTPYARRLTTTLDKKNDETPVSQYGFLLSNYPDTAHLLDLTQTDNEHYAAPNGEYPLTSMVVSVMDSHNNNTNTDVYGSVMVSGSVQMAYSDALKSSVFKNEDLFLESLNTLTGTKSEITISNKEIDIETVSFNGELALILGLGVFIIGIPAVLLVICLVVFLRRKNL